MSASIVYKNKLYNNYRGNFKSRLKTPSKIYLILLTDVFLNLFGSWLLYKALNLIVSSPEWKNSYLYHKAVIIEGTFEPRFEISVLKCVFIKMYSLISLKPRK